MEPAGHRAPGIARVPVRTPTLPPATHTNTWIAGEGRFSVFDPASPWEDEQDRLASAIEARIDAGEVLERLVLTHHHHDHVGGAVALRERLARRGLRVPIAAHPVTARLLDGLVDVDETIEAGARLACGERTLVAHHTPGHAPGHLVFHDPASGALIAGDMVAGVGTIVVDPSDGHLGQYLASLEAMRALGASVLLPAHGDPLPHAEELLSFYVAHRHGRTDQIRRVLERLGEATPLELATAVYAAELDPRFLPLAARQVQSHLRWMAEHGLASSDPTEARWTAIG